jgi:hypothetical protein
MPEVRGIGARGPGRSLSPADSGRVAGASPAPSVLVEGIANTTGVTPPDPNGDVGPTQYVQAVNHPSGSLFSVFAKDGSLLSGPTRTSGLWTGVGGACENNAKGDPIVQYDQLAGRWLITQFAFEVNIFGFPVGPYFECIAVSSSSDALGGGTAYSFLIHRKLFPDFPKFGVWHDAYYMSAHLFNRRGSYKGQGIIAFDRDSMLAGIEARQIQFFFNKRDFGALPTDLVGPTPPLPGTPNFLVVVKDDDLGARRDRVIIREFHVNWDDIGQTFVGRGTKLRVAPFKSKFCGGSDFCIPQPDTRQKLDPLAGFAPDRSGFPGGLLLSYPLSYRRFSTFDTLVFNHTVNAGRGRAGIRWYQIIDPGGTPFIFQQGTYAPDSLNRWVGSISMDGAQNMAVGFSVSSRSLYPSIGYTGRLATDPVGSMGQGEVALVLGGGSQIRSNRWGDYTSMMVDPVDDCTFWYTNQYYASSSRSRWRTAIAAFRFPSCP